MTMDAMQPTCEAQRMAAPLHPQPGAWVASVLAGAAGLLRVLGDARQPAGSARASRPEGSVATPAGLSPHEAR